MSDEYVDGVFNGLKSIRNVKEEILSMAGALEMTGNQTVATKMRIWYEDLTTHTDQIQSAVSRELNRRPGGKLNIDVQPFDDNAETKLGDIIGLGDGNG